MLGDWSFKRHMMAAVRFGLVAMIAVGLFWGIFYLRNGSVPTITAIGQGENAIRLPFTYSRWLDVPFAFLAVAIQWLIYATIISATVWDSKQKAFAGMGTTCGLVIGLILGLVTALMISTYPAGLIVFPVALVLCALVAAPFMGASGSLTLALTMNLGYSTIVGVAAGVGIGLAVGLTGFLVSAVIIATGCTTVELIENICKHRYLRSFWRWLVAADVNGKK